MVGYRKWFLLGYAVCSLLLVGCTSGDETDPVDGVVDETKTEVVDQKKVVGIVGGDTSSVKVSGSSRRDVGIIERTDEQIRKDLSYRYPKLDDKRLDYGVKYVKNLVVNEGLPDALWNEYYVEPKDVKVDAKALVDSLSGESKFSVGDTKIIEAGGKRMDLINVPLRGLVGKDRAGIKFTYDLVTYGYGDEVIVLVNRGGKLSDYKMDVFPSHIMTYDMTAYMFAIYFTNLAINDKSW